MPRRPASSKRKTGKSSTHRRHPSAKKLVSANDYLQQLGEKIRAARTRHGFTLRQLAKKSGLSVRFLAKVELGRANISVVKLREISLALATPLETLAAEGSPASPSFEQSAAFLKKLPSAQLNDAHRLLLEKFGGSDDAARRGRIALIGLRGAGKSTLGSRLAQKLNVPFIELDKLVERNCGLTLSIIFDLYGESGYRRLEREALDFLIAKVPMFVVAAGGGVVSEPGTYNRLLAQCFTIWLRAKPEVHMSRVLAQGDRRPIAQSRRAMGDLRRILWSRETLYRQADAVLETTNQTVSQSLQALLRISQTG